MSEKRTELKLQLEDLLHQLDRTQAKAKGQDAVLEQKKRQEIKRKVNQVIDEHISSTRDHVKTAFDSAMEEIGRELSTLTSSVAKRLMPAEESPSEERNCLFSQKVHRKECSLLVRMMKNPDFKTILNIFVAALFLMLSAEIAKDFSNHGSFVDLSLFSWAMGKLHYALTFWLVQNFWAWLVVPLVQAVRAQQLPLVLWVLLYSALQLGMYTVSFWFAVYNSLPIGSGFVVTCEMARLSMKMHSYLREKLLYGNGPNQYSTYLPEFLTKRGFTVKDLHNPSINILTPSIETVRWLKFCFTPTLIYRDQYPVLAAKHRWNKVFDFSMNIVLTLLFVFIIFRQLCIPHLNESWKQPLNVKFILSVWLESMLPAILLLILMFFGFLHSWQNLWAELMLYGDRHFYDDWWSVSSFGAYYRKWNIVVHEWLYHYIYQDLVRFSKGKVGRGFSFIFVFVFSNIIHEMILAASLGFFYPILLFLFGGPGILFIQLTKNKKEPWNIFVWAMLLIGTGVIVIFYSWEFYARESLDLSPQYGVWAWFIPHSWIPLGLISI